MIYYILNSGAIRFIGLDETLRVIHKDYLHGFFEFFNQLKDNYGFNFLFITHSKEILDFIDSVYLVEDGKIILIKDIKDK